MTHEMKLNHEPFLAMKNYGKTIEMRLFDDKRRLINQGDNIIFKDIETGELLQRKVVALHVFANFNQLYSHFDKKLLGYLEDETAHPEDMAIYYSKEDIEKYGVVGIELQKI